MMDISKIAKVLPINKDSTNLIFIAQAAISLEDASHLVDILKRRHKADFGALVVVRGNPNEVVKLISAKDLHD